MKTVGRLRVAVAGLMLVAATNSWAGIAGSKHDFANDAWNDSGGTNTTEYCAPCHTPHNAQSTQLIPLWNHAATTNSFTMYVDSSSIQGTIDATPNGESMVCLSCHDGTIALNAYGANSTNNSGTKIGAVNASALLGTDLRNDHPISITYSAADTGLKDKTTEPSGLGGTIEADLLFSTGTKVECASCHNAHGGAAGTKLLRKANTASALCLTCHDK